MSQLLPCSHCQRTFTLRDDVSDKALLRCPNCSSQIRVNELQDAIYAPWHVVHDPAHEGLALTPVPLPSLSNAEDQVDSCELTVVEAFDETCVIDADTLEATLKSHEVDEADIDAADLLDDSSPETGTVSEDIYKTLPQSFKMSHTQPWDEMPSDSEDQLSTSASKLDDASSSSVDDESLGTVEEFEQPELLSLDADDDDYAKLPDDESLSQDDSETHATVHDTLNADEMQLEDLVDDLPEVVDADEISDEDGDSQFDTHNEFQLESATMSTEGSDLEPTDILASDRNAMDVDASDLDADDLDAGDLRAVDLDSGNLDSSDLQVGALDVSDSQESHGSEALSLANNGEAAVVAKPPKRARQVQRSGLGSLIQVVLGGAAAIPVTLLLLWYVVGIDVADAGPMVSQVAPWIVPQKFRGTPMAKGNRVTPPSSMDEMMTLDGGANAATSDSEPAPTTSAETPASTNNEPSTAEPTTAEPAPGAEPNATQPANAPAPVTTSQLVADASQPATADTTNAAVNAAVNGAANVGSEALPKLVSAKQKIQQWKSNTEGASDEVKKKHILELLTDLCAASNAAAEFPEGSTMYRAARSELGEVGRSLIADADLEAWFRKAVYAQFRITHDNPGRVLLMNLGDKAEAGDTWQVTAADPLLNTPGFVLPTLEVPKQLIGEVSSGQRVFMLGKMITTEQTAAPKKPLFRAAFVYEL